MKTFYNADEMDKDKESNKNNKRALMFIISYIRRYLPRIIPGITCLIVVDIIQIFIPKIVQRTVDLLSLEKFTISTINRYAILIVIMAIGMVVIRFLWRIFIIGTARRIERDLRRDMFTHLESLGFSFFNGSNTGTLMALMTNDVNAVRMAAGPTLIGLTDIFFMGILSLIFMLRINVNLTLLVVSPLPLIVFVMIKFGPKIVKRYKKVQGSFANLSKASQDAFSGIRVIKGFNAENQELDRFDVECEKYVASNISFVKLWGLFFPSVALLASISLTILLFAGGREVIIGGLSFGEFISFTMYINLLIWPVAAIGWVFSILQRGIASASRILNLMDKNTELETENNSIIAANSSSIFKKPFKGEINYSNIWFRYSEKQDFILRDFNLYIPQGTVFGIIGKPGSGKSTLLNLIFRLFPFEKGSILLDKVDIKNIPVLALRKKIAMAPQDPFLFSDTIYNNITFGADDLDLATVEKLAKLVQIYDEIMDFEEGFETKVGERGVTLSGGQLQRISLARALAVNPDIIVMDDALSQVDTSKEIKIVKNILNKMEGKTVIMVSHRIATLKMCTNIAVINEGRVFEKGTHEDLIKSKGYYRRVYELQRFEKDIV